MSEHRGATHPPDRGRGAYPNDPARAELLARLDVLGEMTGGIAHDFNNIVAVILNYAATALDRVETGQGGDGALTADLHEIQRAAQRAQDLTRRLLVLSRDDEDVAPATTTDLARTVRGAEGLLRGVLGDGVELHLVLDRRLPPTAVERSELERMLVNLVTNAAHAMPDGGILTIEANSTWLTTGDAPAGIVPGPYARLTVSDTGIGMSHETRERAIEPLYTTRPAPTGSGLGLTTVHLTVRRRGGVVLIDSEPGSGTAVHLLLPFAAARELDPDPPDAGDTRRPRAGHGGDETVLVVEDERPVRRMVAEVLRRAGYRVHEASGGRAALETLATHEEIELVLTDLAMPERSGVELARDVRGAAVVLMSGGSRPAAGATGDIPVLQKPFDASTLLAVVRRALDARAATSPSRTPG